MVAWVPAFTGMTNLVSCLCRVVVEAGEGFGAA